MINWIIVEEQCLNLELSSLKDYLIALESFMFEKQLSIEAEFLKFKTENFKNEEYAQVLEERYSEDYQNFSKEYPNKLRLASLLETYTVLEKYLIKVCMSLKDSLLLDEELPQKPNVGNLKCYLKTNCSGIDFNEFNPEWESIDNIRLIRNLIAHGYGAFEIEVDDKGEIIKGNKISTFLLKNSNITILENEEDLKKRKEGIYNIHLPSMDLNIELIGIIRSFAQKISSTDFIAKEGRVK
jgi:hypothetical protein